MARPIWDRKPRLKKMDAELRDPVTDKATVAEANKQAKKKVAKVNNAMTKAFKASKPKKGK